MKELVLALGLAMALEGAVYAAFPGAMRRALQRIGTESETALRFSGLIALTAGVVLVWIVRH